ncbi:MAG: PorT family protein [Hymenobacter sp.]|nr:MAG: PorT family protein [Hymenobacter sp.]
MKYLLLLGAGLLSRPAQAQLGLRLGGNLLHIASDDSLATSSRLGYQVGLFYQVQLTQRFSLVPEVQFSGERVQVSSAEAAASPQTAYQLRFSYLNVPVLARVELAPLYVEAGPQVSWLVGGRGEGAYTAGSNVVGRIDQALTERYRRFDAGLCVGVGVKLPANLGLNLRLYQGLVNMVRQVGPPYSVEAIPYVGRSNQRRQTLQVALTYQLPNK